MLTMLQFTLSKVGSSFLNSFFGQKNLYCKYQDGQLNCTVTSTCMKKWQKIKLCKWMLQKVKVLEIRAQTCVAKLLVALNLYSRVKSVNYLQRLKDLLDN